jgi:hypothetical protein
MAVRALSLAAAVAAGAAVTYDAAILERGATPALSITLPEGHGHSNCTFSFNPAFIERSATVQRSAIIFRASGCSAAFGGSGGQWGTHMQDTDA